MTGSKEGAQEPGAKWGGYGSRPRACHCLRAREPPPGSPVELSNYYSSAVHDFVGTAISTKRSRPNLPARGPAEAIELLTVNPQEEADVVPAENGAKDLIEFEEVERVGHGEVAHDHRTHVAENGSQNQPLERGVYAHSFRLPAACH